MTRTKDKIVDAMNAPNIDAIEAREAVRDALGWQNRLVNAQMAMKGVTKDSRVAFGNQRYAYTSAEDMIGACREALLSAGLAMFRSWTIQHSEAGSFVLSTFTLAYPGGSHVVGDLVPFPIVSTNGKGEDKSVATALTSSLGYFLRDLLLVPKEDDAAQTVKAPEMDARDDRTIVPDTGIGVRGAIALKDRLAKRGIAWSVLEDAMMKAGIALPPDWANWPKSLMPRIEKWLETQASRQPLTQEESK